MKAFKTETTIILPKRDGNPVSVTSVKFWDTFAESKSEVFEALLGLSDELADIDLDWLPPEVSGCMLRVSAVTSFAEFRGVVYEARHSK